MSIKFGILLLVLLYSTGYCTGCFDWRSDCDALARDFQCHSNPYATLRECPKSCGVCNSIDSCKDRRSDCAQLTDDCHSNPYSTIMECPVTCGACWH